MAALKEWLYQIIFYLCLMTVVLQLIPENGLKKYVRFFLGLLFILVALQPAARLFGSDFEQYLAQFDGQLNAIISQEEKEGLEDLWSGSEGEEQKNLWSGSEGEEQKNLWSDSAGEAKQWSGSEQE